MISVVFAQGKTTAAAQLYQWDYGQQLQIQGLSLPETFEMHFQNGTGTPVSVEGSCNNGVGTVDIPDECLQRAFGSFRGWIYFEDESSGKTVATVAFQLKKREQPSDIPPVASVTEIKGYADYVAANAQKVAEAQQAADAANAAAQAANAAAADIYTKTQVESLVSSAIADVSALIGGAS